MEFSDYFHLLSLFTSKLKRNEKTADKDINYVISLQRARHQLKIDMLPRTPILKYNVAGFNDSK